jgi:flagellar basal-body rod protein FlgF
MDRGIYIAASGMLAEQVRQDQIAADLANASTPGYKADRSAEKSFGELLLRNREDGSVVGPLGLGTRVDKVVTSLAQAPLRQTDEPLDVALEGDGFLAIQTPQGVRYTRDGQMVVDAQGRLATASYQQPVLDQTGRPIVVGSGQDVSIAADGTVQSGGRAVGRLGVFALANAKKFGDNLFTGTPGARPAATQVRQGFLEASGVDAARAMVDMITSLRQFEASQRVIHAIDETLGRGIQAGGPNGG